jgi:TonB family protein
MRFTRHLVLALSLLASIPVLATEGHKLIKHPAAAYPEVARRMHMTGKVEVEVVVGPDGSVKNAKVLSGNSMLAGAAISAARDYKYEPGEEFSSVVTFEFH